MSIMTNLEMSQCCLMSNVKTTHNEFHNKEIKKYVNE